MKTKFIAWPWILILLNFVISLYFIVRLPSPTPVGIMPNGEPMRYSIPWKTAFFFPLLSLLAYVLPTTASRLDPQLEDWRRTGVAGPVMGAMLTGFLVANLLSLLTATGDKSLIPYHFNIMMAAVAVFLIFLGLYQSKWASQGFWSVLTPWMRRSETVRVRTDLLFSRLYMVSGGCLLLASWLTLHQQAMFFWGYFPMNLPILILFAAVLTPMGIGYIASYCYFLEERQVVKHEDGLV